MAVLSRGGFSAVLLLFGFLVCIYTILLAGGSPAQESKDEPTGEDTGPPATAFSIHKTDNPDPVSVGEDITYTINVNNNGSDTAQDVVLTDSLPANATFQSVSTNQGQCTTLAIGASSGTITCNLGDLVANGGGATVTLVVRPTAVAGDAGFVQNTATADGSNTNPDADTELTQVESSDLAITKDDDPDPVEVGDFLLYTLEVANGTASSQDVVVTDELPASVDLLAVDSSEGDCEAAGRVVTCQIGNLAPDETATVQILVEPEHNGTIENLAQVFSASDLTTPIDEVEENTTVRGAGRATIVCRGGTCRGTERSDEIRGSNVRDQIYAKAGHDEVEGGYSGDKIYGSRGGDNLNGDFSVGSEEETTTGGNDWVYGGRGNDTLYGGPANDYLKGDDGNDTIDAREFSDIGAGAFGQDVVIGGAGDDTIDAVDLNSDQIYCGKGTDTVRYEPERDTLPNPEQCENKEAIDPSLP